MRRGRGLASVDRSKIANQRYAAKGTELADAEISHMVKQLDSFKQYLETFATKHKSDIKKNPEFRKHFQKLCSQIGVDPLQSSRGFWTEVLGVGDFYYELGVQVTEVCLATKSKNGGLIPLDELHKQVLKGRARNRQDVSPDDLCQAIKKLSVLGSGFKVLQLENGQLVQSVPSELNTDHTTVLQTAEKTAHTSLSVLKGELGWDEERCQRSISFLMKEGMMWVDEQCPNEVLYWVPGFFTETPTA